MNCNELKQAIQDAKIEQAMKNFNDFNYGDDAGQAITTLLEFGLDASGADINAEDGSIEVCGLVFEMMKKPLRDYQPPMGTHTKTIKRFLRKPRIIEQEVPCLPPDVRLCRFPHTDYYCASLCQLSASSTHRGTTGMLIKSLADIQLPKDNNE